jgi:hypothetical protein
MTERISPKQFHETKQVVLSQHGERDSEALTKESEQMALVPNF